MSHFDFKQFRIEQDRCAMKVGTDGVLLGAWAEGGRRVLDIGTGTGLIALMMAQRFENAAVTAIDIDAEACVQARENVLSSPFADRVEVVHASLQDFCATFANFRSSEQAILTESQRSSNSFPATWQPSNSFSATWQPSNSLLENRFDCIVSNPPFFEQSLKNPDQRKATARHADSLPFSDLFEGVSQLLSDEGIFSVVIPVEKLESFLSNAYLSGFYIVRQCMIKTTRRKPAKRCLLAFQKHLPASVERAEFYLQNDDGTRSDWYRHLTKNFYL